jgi:hypothetical protein
MCRVEELGPSLGAMDDENGEPTHTAWEVHCAGAVFWDDDAGEERRDDAPDGPDCFDLPTGKPPRECPACGGPLE